MNDRIEPAETETAADPDVVRRLMWAGLVALMGALASIIAHRASGALWQRVFNEEPPE